MDYITTYSGEDFSPLEPDKNQIHIEDIAHALSLMCRANGHFRSFYSIAQHCINCAIEAKARGFAEKVQKACLLHDASEAYLSDITRPVKKHLSIYREIEMKLQDMIYEKFLPSSLSEIERNQVTQIDNDMLIYEFNALMNKEIFEEIPKMNSNPKLKLCSFIEVEKEFLDIYFGNITTSNELRVQITNLEKRLVKKRKIDVINCIKQYNILDELFEKQYIKKLSAQVDVAIHAYGILIALSKIMEDDEVIEYLSLGAGNTGKDFDVSTNKRIAEFKFAKWDDKNNTIRQNGIFKDFLELALNEKENKKDRYLYCLNAEKVKMFFNTSERSLESVLSRNTKNKKYHDEAIEYKIVKTFYNKYKDSVKIIELGVFINMEID